MDCKDCIYIQNVNEKIEINNKKIDSIEEKLERGNKRFETLEQNETKQSMKLDTIISEQKSIKSVLIKIAFSLIGFIGSVSVAVLSAYIIKVMK